MQPRLAVITGASKGIGEACARRFLREGATVIGISTSPPGPELAAHPAMHAVVGNVADPAKWEEVAAIWRRLGIPPTTLVLNAAKPAIGTVITLDLATWKDQFDGNVFGAVLGARTCLPDMIANGGGSVVVVSSVNGWMAEQELIAYSCTKAALIELARSIAVDHAREGIRCNAIAPGVTDTPALRRAMGTAEDLEAWLKTRAARNPMGRILSADEIANVAWFLASDESSGMTGAVLTVDAGLTASFDYREPGGHGYRADAGPAT